MIHDRLKSTFSPFHYLSSSPELIRSVVMNSVRSWEDGLSCLTTEMGRKAQVGDAPERTAVSCFPASESGLSGLSNIPDIECDIN